MLRKLVSSEVGINGFWQLNFARPDPVDENAPDEICISAKVKLIRSGIETKLVSPSGPEPRVHDRSIKALQQALLKPLQWNDALLSGELDSFEALIKRIQLNPRQTHRLRQRAFLAPDIIERIIAGDVPETLTLERLKKDFPLDWANQHNHFGL
jgi:hypothetical protein